MLLSECVKMCGGDASLLSEKWLCRLEKGKSSITFPFESSMVIDENCKCIIYNRGLFTQCENKSNESEECCKKCSKKSEKQMVKDRIAGGDNFMDSKGRKVTPYYKWMKKCHLTKEDVLEEAKIFNITVNEALLSAPEKEKKAKKISEKIENSTTNSRGRPKSSKKKSVQEEPEDIFANLIQENAVENVESVESVESVETVETVEKKVKKSKVSEEKVNKITDDEKAEKKATVEAEKAAKKATVEAEKAAKKATVEAEKAAEKAAKKAEKTNKKPTKVEAKKEVKNTEEIVEAITDELESESEDDEEAGDVQSIDVKKFIHNEISYLKSTNGVIYDYDTQEEIGTWNETTQQIDIMINDCDE